MSLAEKEAMAVKRTMSEKLSGQSWLRGIGMVRGSVTPTIRVNVSKLSGEITQLINNLAGEVPVTIDEVGDIKAQK